MSERCPHVLRIRRDALDCDPPLVRVTSRCYRCGAWFSLGPSDETQVAVEVRAARFADAHFGDFYPVEKSTADVDGWIASEKGRGCTSDEEAGWLGHVIIDHDHDQLSLPDDLLPDAIALAMRAPRIR